MEGTLPLVHAKSNPKAERRLKQATAQARKLGLKAGPNAGKTVTIPGKGRYVFPFPENKGWVWSRTDMGTDFAYTKEGAPIRALSSGTIVAPIPGEAHWEGGNGLVLKLDHSKGLPSPYVFLYEGITPTVSPGQRVAKGQLIARGGITGSIETGFSNSEGVPLAAGEYAEDGLVTKYGQAMTTFLHMVEKGRTRIPLRLLQVGGTLTPTSGGAVVTSGGVQEGVVAPSKKTGKPKQAKPPTARQTFAKLKSLGVGAAPSTSESEAPSQTLKSLEAKYGVHTAA